MAQGKTMSTNSTSVGAFGFQGLPEGTYFVKAHKLGYNDVQTSTEVKAGVNDPPLVKISLVTDRSYVTPYYLVMSQKGYIECGTDVIALCAVPNHFCIPQPPCAAYTPNVTNDQFSVFFPLDAEPLWLQCELIWESTQALGNTLTVTTRVSTPSLHSDGYYRRGMNASEGPSPLLVTDDYDRIHNTKGNGKDALGVNGTGLELDMFSGGAVDTPAGTFMGAQVEQSFKIIAHLFYGYRPPSGWRFTHDGDPPMPE
jgi:hypothetical protein